MKLEIEVLKHALHEVPATTCSQENDIVLGFGDGFVIIRDAFKHVLSFRHHFLSSKKCLEKSCMKKGENKLLKIGDFLEMIVFVVKLKLNL